MEGNNRPIGAQDLRSETPRHEKLRVKWRPEVNFSVPVYFLGAVLELGIFIAIIPSPAWLHTYEEYHFPVMCCIAALPIQMYLGIVTLSPIDEDALNNDPDYWSSDPQDRARAVQRELRQSEIMWMACMCINTFCSTCLTIAYCISAHWLHTDLPQGKVSTAHFAFSATMSFAYALATWCNISGIRRVRRLGRRGFTAGLDSLSLEAAALLKSPHTYTGTVEDIDDDDDSSAGAAGSSGSGGMRQRHGAEAAGAGGGEELEQPPPTPLALATSATQQFMKGNLDRTGLDHIYRTLGIKLSKAVALHHLMLLHERTGKGDWLEFARELQEHLGDKDQVPPRPEDVPRDPSATEAGQAEPTVD